MVSVVFLDGAVFFQTHAHSTKARQIDRNPRVALSSGPLTVEGRAQRLGHPLAPQHARVAEHYQKMHPGSFAQFSSRGDQLLFRVEPTRFIYWRRHDAVPFLEVFEPGHDVAYRDYYLADE